MKVAIYCRVSTKEQAKKHSLDAQKKILTDYCKERNWDYDIYQDDSSGLTMNREGLQKILDNKSRYNILMVTENDRLSRNPDHKVIIRYELKKAGVDFIAVNEPTEKSEFDKLLEKFLDIVSWWEAEQRKRRCERGRKIAIEKGIMCHRKPLKIKNGEVVSRIKELRGENKSLREISKIINEEFKNLEGFDGITHSGIKYVLDNL